MKYQTISTIKANFSAFLKTENVKPTYCKKYGTKYPGELSLRHFVLYAIIRGKSPLSCTHDESSESYKSALRSIELLANANPANNRTFRPFIGSGVTAEDIISIIKTVE